MVKKISISLEEKVLKAVDKQREHVKRSTFINATLEEALGNGGRKGKRH